MKHTYLLSLVFLFSFYSCSNKKTYPNADTIVLSDFGNPISLTGTIETELSDLLMRPVQMYIYDSLLITKNRGTENFFHIFNRFTLQKTGEFAPFGNGPDEMLEPDLLLSAENPYAIIFDKSKQSIIRCKIEDSITYLDKYRVEQYIDAATISKDETIIATVLNPEFKKFTVFSKAGQFLETFGENPDMGEELMEYENIEAFFCQFVISNPKNRMFVSHKQTDLIEIYDLNGNLIRRLHGPDIFFPEVKQIQKDKEIRVRSTPGVSRDAYFLPNNAGEEVFVLYSGKIFDPNDSKYLMDKIFVFDWEGNPIRRYELDKPIYRFDVDPKNRVIYGLSDDPIFQLIKFDY